MLRPVLVQGREQGGKALLLRRGLGREVAADVERLQIGGEENVVRPAAVARHDLPRQHVDVVDVGPLFAVDQHVDEPAVHQRGDLRVAVKLALRHMAPVTGRVADGQIDGLVLAPRLVQRLRPPGVPVHRIVGMLQQVRIVRIREMIGARRRRLRGHAPGEKEAKRRTAQPRDPAHAARWVMLWRHRVQPAMRGGSRSATACSRAACTACAIAVALPPDCVTC